MRILKKAGHFTLGLYAGWNWRHPAALILTLIMGGYQGLEAYKIRDDGYHELFQYGAGFVVGGVAGWTYRQLKKWEEFGGDE